MLINEELLRILACPKCKGDLEVDADRSRLVCRKCFLAYPVRDGIPIMLIEEAERLEN